MGRHERTRRGDERILCSLNLLLLFFLLFFFLSHVGVVKRVHMCARVRAPSPCVRAAVWGVSWEAVKRRVTGWDPAVKSGGDVCARARAGVCVCVCVCVCAWHRKRRRRRSRRSLNVDILNPGTLLRSKRGQKSAKSPRKSDAHRLCARARTHTRAHADNTRHTSRL